MAEYGDQLDDSERDEVKESLDRAHAALAASDAGTLRETVEDLQQVAYRMTEAMYERLQDA